MKRSGYFLICLICNQFLFAQKIDCEKLVPLLNAKETQIKNLNLHDPDYIPLHYFVAQGIIKELDQLRDEVIPNFTACATITFNELINRYDELKKSVQLKHDSLMRLSKNVYLIFYEKARYEYQFNNEVDGDYFLQRSLQYNGTFPNAILLKLNKLLDRNRFDACLALLNTLYYETQLNDAQEIQAIEFTDKFYDKLYKTGDSLVKMEHAAEALELFEILEIFCHNLPSTYCNDDYYHGVLRSKSGIYESYLAIVRAAEERGNQKIAAHFIQYAQEYLDSNPHLKGYEPVERKISKNDEEITLTIEENTVIEEKTTLIVEKVEQKVTPKEIKEKYDKIVLEALALCINEKFPESYNLFLEAKKLEECRCFEPDFRVDLMLHELSKFELK